MKKVMLSLIGIFAISILGCGGDTEDIVEEIEEDKVPVPIGMVLIPEGPFEMGSNAARANTDEQPVHTVYADAFYMDKREVTVRAYRHFVEETGHRAPDWEQVALYSPTDDHPIVFVSWHDAMAYAKWAGKRLPTEAEWEKAARGNLVGQAYPWGNAAPAAAKVPCNFADKNLTHYWWADKKVDDGYVYTAPVGRYLANKYGLSDMAGNVSEWCLDEYNPSFYAISPDTNPVSGETDTVAGISDNFTSIRSPRVLRGGSWLVNALGVRNAVRSVLNPTSTASSVGFRCVKDLDVLE